MRLNMPFHDCLRNLFVEELLGAFDKSEDVSLSTRERLYYARRVHIWNILIDQEASTIREIKIEQQEMEY